MSGIWEQAFGIKYLAFGDIKVSIGIVPGVAITNFGNPIIKVDFILYVYLAEILCSFST